jgi:hypothetical protein
VKSIAAVMVAGVLFAGQPGEPSGDPPAGPAVSPPAGLAEGAGPGGVDDRPGKDAAGVFAGKPEDKERGAENNILADEMTPEMVAAVEQGLAWLARVQNADGSFGDGRFGPSVAVTALAGLAFMSDGNLPGRGPYGEVVSKALDYVLANCAENGLIASDATTVPMYGHGFATLFLGEIYGMTGGGADTARAQRLHDAIVRSVRLIQSSQNEEGGWRYNPVPNDADVSVTICQIKALRSARNAGIEVSRVTIDRAVDYVRRAQNIDGGFMYQLIGGPSAFARSAAGVASLQYAGVYNDPAIRRGISYITRVALPGAAFGQQPHYFYGHYYAVQAMYLAGGEDWAMWWPAIRQELLRRQEENGRWQDPSVGDHYGTAMSLIILQVPKRYLPIFQR